MSEQETPFWDPNKFYAEPEPSSKEQAPTEEANNQEPEKVETEELRDETIPQETQTEEEAEDTAEESEPQLSDEEYFVPIDEREIPVKQIKEWEKGYLRQSDYTKKTQKLADEKRAFDADRQGEVNKALGEKLEGFDSLIDEMEAMIKQSDEAIDWDDLRQYDIGEYTKQKELKEERINTVANAKLKRQQAIDVEMTPEEIQREQKILIENNDGWLDENGKPTEKHAKDMKLVSDYLVKTGWTVEEQSKIKAAKHWQTLIDAARWNDSQNNVSEIKKKVKKVPLTPKPKKSVSKPAVSRAERFYNS
jgi:hypothetical protein